MLFVFKNAFVISRLKSSGVGISYRDVGFFRNIEGVDL